MDGHKFMRGHRERLGRSEKFRSMGKSAKRAKARLTSATKKAEDVSDDSIKALLFGTVAVISLFSILILVVWWFAVAPQDRTSASS